jgi:hypothetical protein
VLLQAPGQARLLQLLVLVVGVLMHAVVVWCLAAGAAAECEQGCTHAAHSEYDTGQTCNINHGRQLSREAAMMLTDIGSFNACAAGVQQLNACEAHDTPAGPPR